MIKKIVVVLVGCMFAFSMAPTTGECRHHHGGEALLWGLTGLVVGSTLVAASAPPPAPAVVYAAPPPPVYQPPAYSYSYAPPAPVETCRWERYVQDGYGRVMLDGYGRPMREYAVGPCDAPPY